MTLTGQSGISKESSLKMKSSYSFEIYRRCVVIAQIETRIEKLEAFLSKMDLSPKITTYLHDRISTLIRHQDRLEAEIEQFHTLDEREFYDPYSY